ncbi:MAG: DUF1295 domain-containing protein [Pseudomonadota bacterium]|nr:DUF1295 domain-containing protein [Pseudomonadota bacterium]
MSFLGDGTLASIALHALAVMLTLAIATWVVATMKRDVSIVDSMWSVMIFAGALVYWAELAHSSRATLACGLVALWAARLAIYITWRNWGEPEDRRYRAIRERNSPNFALKSLYLVFGLQAFLACIVSMPLLAAMASSQDLGALDVAGAALVAFGIAFESVGDFQLARFKAKPGNRGRVMDSGLWHYTRHPNYFGEFCVWWGFYLVALGAGGAWSMISPLLMTLLLTKVSGVALLEGDLSRQKPDYVEYVRRTPTFFPGRPRGASQ